MAEGACWSRWDFRWLLATHGTVRSGRVPVAATRSRGTGSCIIVWQCKLGPARPREARPGLFNTRPWAGAELEVRARSTPHWQALAGP
jgi:hypothetical protein